jgi:hypothetical protein
MGVGEDAWYLCAEHEDEVIAGAKALADFDETSDIGKLIEENDPGREEPSKKRNH